MLVPGRWFDGLSSKPRPVLVGLRPGPGGPALAVHPLAQPASPPLELSHAQVGWPEAWNARRPPPRVVVDLRGHGSLEIDAVADWQAALAAAGGHASLAERMQTRWGVLLAVLAVSIAGLVLFYRYGTPWMAAQLTRHVPVAWEAAIADNALRQMDDGMLKPSKLPPERQAALRARFDALARQVPPALQRYPGYAPRLTLAFRSGLGANAFALPGGAIVMTDALVEEAAAHKLGDDALVGVLAHEIGHVVHRHTTRMVVEQGVLNVGLGLALGDVSGVVSTGSTLLTGLAYQRNHEREADCFAIALMAHGQLPTQPMADLLLAISRDSRKEGEAGKDTKEEKAEKAHGPLWSLLSSHPDTEARARELKQGHAPHCPRQP
jgi:Zn-dependent protease with chaperone function